MVRMGRSMRDYWSVTCDVVMQRWHCRGVPRLHDIGDTSLQGLNVVVTGCTSGIGKAAATEFAQRQCNLFLACRNAERGEKLKEELEEKYGSARAGQGQGKGPKIQVLLLDLADLQSVVDFGKAFAALNIPLHILVNNAGVFAMSAPRRVCGVGNAAYELHLLTNYLAVALLTLLLLPSLRLAATSTQDVDPKVVMVSSKLHQMCTGFNFEDPNFDGKGSYHSKKAYAQSKLAQILFTNCLRDKLQQKEEGKDEALERIQFLTLHPGNVMTDVVRSLPWAIRKAYSFFMPLFLLSPQEGARSTLFAATESTAHECSENESHYLNSNCKPEMPSEEARDREQGAKLWAWTMEQIGPCMGTEIKDLLA